MQTVKIDPAKLLGFRLVDDKLAADDQATGVVLGAKLGNKEGGKTADGCHGADVLSFDVGAFDSSPELV
jgi:hypothetical protein